MQQVVNFYVIKHETNCILRHAGDKWGANCEHSRQSLDNGSTMDLLRLDNGSTADELLNHRNMLGQIHADSVELRFVDAELVAILQCT